VCALYYHVAAGNIHSGYHVTAGNIHSDYGVAAGNMHSGYGAATLDMSGAADSSANSSYTQNGQDLNSIIEWIKTNETVYKMMQKAKVNVNYLHYIICTTLYALHYMHYIIYALLLYVLHYMHYIICTTLYTLHYIHYITYTMQSVILIWYTCVKVYTDYSV